MVVDDPTSSQPQAHIQLPFNPTVHDSDPRAGQQGLPSQEELQQHVQNQLQLRQQQQQLQLQQQYSSPFDPDDMELDIDLDNTTHPPPPPPPSSRQSSTTRSSPSSCAPSPPDTPISTPLSAYPSPRAFVPHHLPHGGHLQMSHHSPYISQPPSPLSASASTYDPSTAASTRQNSPILPNMPGAGGRPNLNLTLSSGGFPRATPAPNPHLANPEEAFNAYARFASDYSSCMPGAQFNGATVDEASALNGLSAWQIQQQQQMQQQQQSGGCVPPALLFASTSSGAGAVTSPVVSATSSRVPSPTQKQVNTTPPSVTHTSAPSGIAKSQPSILSPVPHPVQAPTPPLASTGSTITSPQSAAAALAARPAPLLLSKPFRCPKPNCNKSYKQANGLKYHMTHGSCNFAPPKDLEHVKDLLERKRREREGMSAQAQGQGTGLTRSTSLGSAPLSSSAIPTPGASSSHTVPHTPTHEPGTPMSPTSILSLTYSDLSNISEHDLREVEREAERRLRPFACGVGDCQRRYKNMNGLRYHYQHSGDHGAVGLALLASGQHECLAAGKRGQAAQQQHHHNQHQLQHQPHVGGVGVGAGSSHGGVQRTGHGSIKGSISVPVSRSGSVSVANSRVGTPQPQSPSVAPGSKTTSITPFLMTNLNTAVSRTHTPVGSTHPSPTGSPLTSPGQQQGQPQVAQAQPVVLPYAQQQTQYTQQQLAAYQLHYAQQIQRHYQAQVAAQQQQQAQSQQQFSYPDPTAMQYGSGFVNTNNEYAAPSGAASQPQAQIDVTRSTADASPQQSPTMVESMQAMTMIGTTPMPMDAASAAAMYARQQHAQNSTSNLNAIDL